MTDTLLLSCIPMHDRWRAAVGWHPREMAASILHELAARTKLGGEYVMSGSSARDGAAAAAVRAIKVDAMPPRTFCEHPITLHAAVTKTRDALGQVELHRSRTTEHRAGAAACIAASRLELT